MSTNDKFNKLFESTTGPKGLEKVVYLIGDFTIKANDASNTVFYGGIRQKADGTLIFNPKNPIDRALSLGLIELTKRLSSVDFCNLLNYLIGGIGGKGFNPKKRPDSGPALTIWNIQNEAFKLQLKIDNTFGEIGDSLTPDATLRLTDLILVISDTIKSKINIIIEEFRLEIQGKNVTQQEFENNSEYQELNKTFQKLFVLKTVLDASADILQSLGSNITLGSFQKGVNTINKVRQSLILIQGINNPAVALTFADQLSGGAVQSSLAEINKLIPVERLVPLLKRVIRQCNNANSTGQKILGQIKTMQFFIKIALVVIKVLRIIKRFFLFGFQLPNLFTTVAVTSTASNAVEEVLSQRIVKLELRLQQINYVLGLIYNFVNSLIASINEILPNLRAILLNIESCSNIDDEIKQDLSSTINNLTATRNSLQDFINTVNNASKAISNNFGEYTIEIVTEQVVDEGINLKRRFGIARGKNNIIAVQSTPTFASLDLIIINEVKALLVSKGLVKSDLSDLSTDTLATISESISYLGDESITLENLESTPIETPEIGEDTDLELGKFVDNLPGGRALRKKVRNKLIKNNETLIKNLRSADPSNSGTQRIIQQKEAETNKLKIEKLEDQKKDLKKALLLAVANPVGAAAIVAKIKAIDNEIKALKNNQK